MRRTLALAENPFRILDEYAVLEKVLRPRLRAAQPDFHPLKQLQKLSQRKNVRKSTSVLLSLPDYGAATESAKTMMRARGLTSKDIDSYLKIHVVGPVHAFELPDQLEKVLGQLISVADPTGLRAVMQFLLKYWESGVNGQRPMIRVARAQAQAVLTRALEIHHATSYQHGVEHVGIPDLPRFDRFVDSLFQYMALQRPENSLDAVDDLLFRLHARCGPLTDTQSRTVELLDRNIFISPQAVEELLATMAKHFAENPMDADTVKQELVPLQDLLVNDITPASFKFLMVWVSSLSELWFLIDSAPPHVLRECQVDIIHAVERFGLKNRSIMAQAVGVVWRLDKVAKLNQDALDYYILACARVGNGWALGRAMDLRNKRVNEPLSAQTIEGLLDSFPLTNFGTPLEQSRLLLERIRPQVPDKLLHKYILALSRAQGDLSREWSQLSPKPLLANDVDILMAFVAASLNTPLLAEVLDHITACSSRVDFISQIRAYGLVDSNTLNRAIAKFVQANPDLSNSDVDALLPDLPNAHEAARIESVDALWPVH